MKAPFLPPPLFVPPYAPRPHDPPLGLGFSHSPQLQVASVKNFRLSIYSTSPPAAVHSYTFFSFFFISSSFLSYFNRSSLLSSARPVGLRGGRGGMVGLLPLHRIHRLTLLLPAIMENMCSNRRERMSDHLLRLNVTAEPLF